MHDKEKDQKGHDSPGDPAVQDLHIGGGRACDHTSGREFGEWFHVTVCQDAPARSLWRVTSIMML
jgi:hypothetical protein